MTSFLAEAVLLVALVVTSWRVGQVYRELRRLRAFQAQFQGALDASVSALESVKAAVELIRAETDAKLAETQELAVPGEPIALRPSFTPLGPNEPSRFLKTASSR